MSHIDHSALSRLDPNCCGSKTSFSVLQKRFGLAQLDHIEGDNQRWVHPYDTFYWEPEGRNHGYHQDIAGDMAEAALRFQLSDFDHVQFDTSRGADRGRPVRDRYVLDHDGR